MRIDRPIAIALILFAVLLIFFFLVNPEYKTLKKLQLELAEKRAKRIAEVEYYNEINRIYFDLMARQEDIKKIDNAIPNVAESGRIIYYLQRIAIESGLMIKDIFLSKTGQSGLRGTQQSALKEITFSINLLGSYSSLGQFLKSLENSERIFEVSNISFGSSATKPLNEDFVQFQTNEIYSFNLQIKTHSY